MQKQPISVSLLSNYIKRIFDSETLLYNIDVVGEISSFGISNGNAFFTLKDSDALLSCVLFDAKQSYNAKVGEKVIVTGTPKYYVKGGKLNFNATKIEPCGEGELYKRFLQLKARLEKEGLFAVEHKKPMPAKIDRIGVVTSETGAVIHDIINIVRRRNASQDIVLYPIKVQGIGADVDIARGINFFSAYDKVDAVIVGRGGGSEDDLQCFNSEIVARAVYDCKKFVVSAVGHETDFTLCDYASDLRAPTPSAAAELLTKDRSDEKEKLKLIMQGISNSVLYKFEKSKRELQSMNRDIQNTIQNNINIEKSKLELLHQQLKNVDVRDILKRGYAKVEFNQKPVKNAKQLKKGDAVDICFYDGTVVADIKEVKI